MKAGKVQKIAAYVGAGAGLALFATYGLYPGSFLGGIAGINIAGRLFGTPLTSDLLPRVIVGISMLLGIFLSSTVFIAGGMITGWVIGKVIDSLNASLIFGYKPNMSFFSGRGKKPKGPERKESGNDG